MHSCFECLIYTHAQLVLQLSWYKHAISAILVQLTPKNDCFKSWHRKLLRCIGHTATRASLIASLLGIVWGECNYITMRSYTSIVCTSHTLRTGTTSSAFLVQCARVLIHPSQCTMTENHQYDQRGGFDRRSVGFFLWGGLVTLDAVISRPCRDSLLEGQLIARSKVTPWLTAPEFRAMG